MQENVLNFVMLLLILHKYLYWNVGLVVLSFYHQFWYHANYLLDYKRLNSQNTTSWKMNWYLLPEKLTLRNPCLYTSFTTKGTCCWFWYRLCSGFHGDGMRYLDNPLPAHPWWGMGCSIQHPPRPIRVQPGSPGSGAAIGQSDGPPDAERECSDQCWHLAGTHCTRPNHTGMYP